MAAPKLIPYGTPEPPIDPHVIRVSDELLADAAEILDRPNEQIGEELLAQVRKQLWGAVTRRLKLFADARGWYYCEDGIAGRLVDRIDEALGADRPELTGRLACAERVYYGGWSLADELDPDEVRYLMPIIRSLCALLDDAHRKLPLNLAPPDDQYYLRAAERCAERRAEASAG